MTKKKTVFVQFTKDEKPVHLDSTEGMSESELAEFGKLQASIIDALTSITKSRWKLGDAVTAWWDALGDEAKRKRIALLKEWTEKVLQPKYDVGWETIRSYALVAQVWKEQDRVEGVSYGVHRELIAAENRHLIRPDMTIAEALAAKREASTERLEQKLDGQTLPRRKPDTPFEDKDRESGHIAVPAGPNAADVRFERNRLEDMFDEAIDLLHEVAEKLPRVAGTVIEDELAWPPAIDRENKVGWNQLLTNGRLYIESIHSTIADPRSFEDGIAELLGE